MRVMRGAAAARSIRPRGGRGLTLGLAPLLLLLGACSAFENATANVQDGIGRTGERLGAPWGGPRSDVPEQTTTMARVRGIDPGRPILQPEPGNVWPAEEAPRATLANPDAALRGIPDYRPGGQTLNVPSEGPAPAVVPPGSVSRGAPARARGSSSPPPPGLPEQTPPPLAVLPPPSPPSPLVPRREGQAIPTPQGTAIRGPTTLRGGSVLLPDGTTGVVIQDGGQTTIIDPGGALRVVPLPR